MVKTKKYYMECNRKICDVKGCQFPNDCSESIIYENKITPFKNRKLKQTKKIEIYRNLRNSINSNKKFSVRQGGLVIGYTNNILLAECEFVINKAGQKRARKTKQRNVHAFIRGFVATLKGTKATKEEWESFSASIHYNPFKDDYFVCRHLTGEQVYVKKSAMVIINNGSVRAAYINK